MITKFKDPNDNEEEEDGEAKEYRDKQDIKDELEIKRMMACGIVESLAASDEFIKTNAGRNNTTIGQAMAYIAAAIDKIFEEIK